MSDFPEFRKIPRWRRGLVVTEKIDGTNGLIYIAHKDELPPSNYEERIERLRVSFIDPFVVFAGSRTRWITPGDDNFGFAAWVQANAEELVKLGPGHHYGEWWGRGIQRNYGLSERRFSLFDAIRWGGKLPTQVCSVVPILARGVERELVDRAIDLLRTTGSVAAPGFASPEGVVVLHEASNHMYKQTVEHDDDPKSAHARVDRPPQERRRVPYDPNTTGRRKGCEGYTGILRRKTDRP